jgi:hypothetical protein
VASAIFWEARDDLQKALTFADKVRGISGVAHYTGCYVMKKTVLAWRVFIDFSGGLGMDGRGRVWSLSF